MQIILTMEAAEFKIFLKKLKEISISQRDFANWCGYSTASFVNFTSGKKKIPLILKRVLDSFKRDEAFGVDLKNIIK
jgi:hypothetical protein